MEIQTEQIKKDWKNIFSQSLTSKRELDSFFCHTFPETNYPIRLPMRIANKIKVLGLDSKLAKQYLPHENEKSSLGHKDPIGDQVYKTSNIIHRYQNRALILPTTICPTICRYCFRKNELYEQEFNKKNLAQTDEYLSAHPEIEEIIFSGGDPFILSENILFEYLNLLKKHSHIKSLRFHTKTFVTIPERLTAELMSFLEKCLEFFENVTIVHHLNTADEIDDDVKKVFKRLRKLPLHQFSQSVLLKDINDTTEELTQLFQKLSANGVIPYYLHHPDQVKGGLHFYISLEEGRKIYHSLRQKLPGWMIPQYILDLPNGEGKTPVYNPHSFKDKDSFINKDGKLVDVSFEY
tara:strand:- start:69202 stop:70251 length:1050 start_codon:yes stop_codon:yes gene_type:complete